MRRLLLVLLLGLMLAAPVMGLQTTAVSEKNGKEVDSPIKDLKDNNSSVRSEAA
jgi:hypothetical protein